MKSGIGKVVAGELVPESRADYRAALIANEGRKVVWSVKRWQPKRSHAQNAYYHAVVVPYWMEAQGERDHMAMHEILRLLYNYKPVQVGAEVVRVGLPTRTLETGAFSEFVERCCQGFAEEFGGEIPPPSSAVSQEMMAEYAALGNVNQRME